MSDFASSILTVASAAADATPDPETPLDQTPTDTSDALEVQPADEGATTDSTGDKSQETVSEVGSEPPKLPTTAEIRASLKAFRESNPEHSQAAKLLNDGYSRYEAYKGVFPTVEEARNIRAQLDVVGGLEGIAELQSTVSSVEQTDSLLDAGDPQVLDQVIEDSPDGFKRLAPHYLDKLEKLDRAAYDSTLRPHLVRGLVDANLPNVLSYLSQAIKANPDEAVETVRNIMQWFEQQKSLAERSKQDILNPEREQLATERSALQEERLNDLKTGVANVVGPHINQELGSRLKPYSAALNALPVAIRQDIARSAINMLAETLEADKVYQNQIKAMLGASKPDRAKLIAINKQKVSSLADGIIRKVVANYSLKPGAAPAKRGAAAAAKPGAQKVASTKIIKITKAPGDHLIDWSHPNMNQEAFIRHRAILKDGRMVEWE